MAVSFPLHDNEGTVSTLIELNVIGSSFSGVYQIGGTFQKVSKKGYEIDSKVMLFEVYLDGKLVQHDKESVKAVIANIGKRMTEKTCSATLVGRELRILTKT